MRDRKKPEPKISDFDKWLQSMIVEGEVQFSMQLFQNHGKSHQFQFLFPNRKNTSTSHEDELDDLRRYFKKISSHPENKMNRLNQHLMIFPVPAEWASAELINKMHPFKSLATRCSLAKHTIDTLRIAIFKNENDTLESITIFHDAALEYFQLIKQHSMIKQTQTFQNLLHDCQAFYLHTILNHNDRQALFQHLAPITELMQSIRLEIAKCKHTNRDLFNDHLYREVVMNLTETAEFNNSMNVEKRNEFANHLVRLIRVIRPHKPNELAQMAEEISNLFLDGTVNQRPVLLQCDKDKMSDRLHYMRKLVACYARALDLWDIGDDFFSPIKASLALSLIDAIKRSMTENTPPPDDDLLQKLRDYEGMVNTLGECFEHQLSPTMAQHLLAEYDDYSKKMRPEQNMHVEFKENASKILAHLAGFRKLDLISKIPKRICERFINDEFNQTKLPVQDTNLFCEETNLRFQPINILGRINSLTKVGLIKFAGNKLYYAINEIRVNLALVFVRIETDSSKSIAEHIRQFLKLIGENNDLMTLLNTANAPSFFGIESNTGQFIAQFGKLINELEALITPSSQRLYPLSK